MSVILKGCNAGKEQGVVAVTSEGASRNVQTTIGRIQSAAPQQPLNTYDTHTLIA